MPDTPLMPMIRRVFAIFEAPPAPLLPARLAPLFFASHCC
jgi:hypothetical protein